MQPKFRLEQIKTTNSFETTKNYRPDPEPLYGFEKNAFKVVVAYFTETIAAINYQFIIELLTQKKIHVLTELVEKKVKKTRPRLNKQTKRANIYDLLILNQITPAQHRINEQR